MLVLNDFSAVMQVLIAFYAVYVVGSENILDTFIFSNLKDELQSLKDEASRQYNDSQKDVADIKKESRRIDKNKLSKPQSDLVRNSIKRAEQAVQMRKSIKDLMESFSNDFIGVSYFSVLSVDVVLLCFLLMLIGALDCRLLFCADAIAGALIVLILLLEVHCFLYRYSSKIRSFEYCSPKTMCHIKIIFSVCIFLVVACVFKVDSFIPAVDIKCYMLLFAIVSLIPPILEVSVNYRAVKRMRRALKDNDETRKFVLNWFKKEIDFYVEMYCKGN